MNSVWGCIPIWSAECFIQKAGHWVWPLFCGCTGCCGFLKKLLETSPLETTGQCFVAFLQSKYRWGQGQTTREGSWAFVQDLWGVTCISERVKANSVLTSPEFAQHVLWLWPKTRQAKGKVPISSWWSRANRTLVVLHTKEGCAGLWMASVSP